MRLRFTVRDTGIGIPQDKQWEIFGAFVQADASTTRRYGGTGLGLTISAQLVEMMDGRMWLDSEPGKGSQFHFVARFGIAQDAAEPLSAAAGNLRRPAGPRRRRQRDQPPHPLRDSRQLADAGVGGRRRRRRRSSRCAARPTTGSPFHLLLTDALMPDVDGFDARAADRSATTG